MVWSIGEREKTEESARGGVGPIGWPDPQQGQEDRQQRERTKGRPGQKPQEEDRCPPQCTPATARTPQERLNVLVEKIRARFGNYTIGRGDGGIRYSAPTPHRG